VPRSTPADKPAAKQAANKPAAKTGAKKPAAKSLTDDRRTVILTAAVEAIATDGLASVRVSDVARASSVSTALVFYHFTTKEQLVAEAFEFAAARDLAKLDAILDSKTSAMARLRGLLALYSPGSSGSSAWALWIEAWAASLHVDEVRAVSKSLDARWKDGFARIAADGVAEGLWTCADPASAAWRVSALVDGLSVQLVAHKGALRREQIREWIRGNVASELGISPESLV
jgi:AcrR family transcriptional regulator